MKTKHLFFATALVASFASCTNDDIVEMQQGSNVERPTVDNVQLNFVAEGVDSRLTFGSNGYAWEADDVIGALNMDQPIAGAAENANWTAKYEFTDFINTSYPFTYDAEAGTWGTLGKMLEGNYFFAFPFADYEGERYAKYSLIDQQQNGIKGAVVAENYANNQVFVGYSQIKKGTGFDILNDIEMTSLLGAVQLRIKNEGTKTYHINKVVIEGTGVKSAFVLDPKTANYDGEGETSVEFNLEASGKTDHFNFANYVGDAEADEYTITDENAKYYNRMEALREVANYNGDKGFVQLFVNGTAEERALAVNGTAYALVMVNPVKYFTTDKYGDYTTTLVNSTSTLTATIYTDEGISVPVNLLYVAEAEYMAEGNVNSTEPGVPNTVVITLKDKDIKESKGLDIYTEEDLMQLISWNTGVARPTTVVATLKADIELTKEAVDLLKTNDKLTLSIVNAKAGTKTLTLASDLPADVLEYEGLAISTDASASVDSEVAVKVAGEIDLTKESIDLYSIEVLEGATLNINVLNANVPAVVTVDEGATLNIGAAAKTSNNVAITNNGTMEVAAGALVQGPITNKAKLNLNGVANNVANQGVVNMGAVSKIIKGTNSKDADNNPAVINMTSGATLSNINEGLSTDLGRVKYVDGAVIVFTGTGTSRATTVNSDVFVEVGNATITADTYKEKGVNLWVLTGDLTVSTCVSLVDVEIAEETTVVLTVAADSTLTVTGTMTVPETAALSTNGNVVFANLKVEKDAEWTNNGTATISGALTNYGDIYNNGTAKAGTTATATLDGVVYEVENGVTTSTSNIVNKEWSWMNNNFLQYYVPTATNRTTTMYNAVAHWLDRLDGENKLGGSSSIFWNGNPYSYKEFLTCITLGNPEWNAYKNPMTTAPSTGSTDYFTADELNWAKIEAGTATQPSEFADAVNRYFTDAMVTAVSGKLFEASTSTKAGQFLTAPIALLSRVDSYIFEDAAEINDYVEKTINLSSNVLTALGVTDYKTLAAAWDIADATMTTAITTTEATKYFYINESDTIYTVARLWKKHSERITTGITNLYDKNNVGSKNTVANLQKFVNELSNIKSSERTEAQQEAYTAFADYKEFILALPKELPTYTQGQITTCAEWDESAERTSIVFETPGI